MPLSNSDLIELTEFRRALHALPELSGEEKHTARMVLEFLAPLKPDHVISNIGGHGLAVVFEADEPGVTVLLRCELDGLAIEEISSASHASKTLGKAHLCGHDGHMAIICGVARMLEHTPPHTGRVVLLFQPAEEIGSGARAIIEDPKFQPLKPDYAFALHNLPGLSLGHAEIKKEAICCASKGLVVKLHGKTSHAAAPQDGVSPRIAMSEIMELFQHQSTGQLTDGNDYALVTLVHAKLGEPAFGISPGDAEVWATLRTVSDLKMEQLVAHCEASARQIAREHQLDISFDYDDEFVASCNNPEATELLQEALEAKKTPLTLQDAPKAFSEDFGLFGHDSKMAMFFLGAGEDHPQLHNPDYDFPDELISVGAGVFDRLLRNILG